MINPINAYVLARTKMKSKRGLLWTSIIVASTLFAALICAVIVYTGISQSAETFLLRANDNRYLVRVEPIIPTNVLSYGSDLTLTQVRDIQAYQTTYYEKIRDQYKALGLTYDASTEIAALRPSSYKSLTIPTELRVDVNYQSPVVKEYFNKRLKDYIATAPGRIENLKEIASSYGGSGYYVTRNTTLPTLPQARLIVGNKEDFSQQAIKTGDYTPNGYFINAINNGFYDFGDEVLQKRYLLTTKLSDMKGIPVIVSAQEAVNLFGSSVDIGSEPKDDTAKAIWLQNVQSKLNNKTYQVCYRNASEQAMLTEIQADYEAEIAGKGDKNFVEPSLKYRYPTSPCGDITIISDSRTATEKKAATDYDTVQKKLGTYEAPAHRLVTFQIVGFINARRYISTTKNASDFIKNLLTVDSPSMSAIIPTQQYDRLPSNMKLDDLMQTNGYDDTLVPRVLSFTTIDQARSFMAVETCPTNEADCTKTYSSEPYGSNYLILQDLGILFNRYTAIAFPIVLGLSLIILLFTVSRIMAENRKETAIYRAMGASRSDISAIYLIYLVMIAVRITILSLFLGIVSAYVIDKIYSSRLTDIAVSSFGIASTELRFRLFEPLTPLVGNIVLAILFICVLAGLPVLMSNILRHPSNDLRAE